MIIKNLIWQEAQTIFVAGLFTVLVWVYAEGENIRGHDLFLEVQFVAPSGRQLWIEPRTPYPVQATVMCSNTQWDQVQTLAKNPLLLEVAEDPANREQVVNLRERLRNYVWFSDLGIHVSDVRGENPTVGVESLGSRLLPVGVALGEMELAGPATVGVEAATVMVPLSQMALLDAAKLEVRLDGLNSANLPENVPLERELPVELAAGPEEGRVKVASITPARAKVVFTIRKRTESLTVPIVTALVVMPPPDTARFAVDVSEEHRFVRDVVVTGPHAMIDRIKKNEVKIWAYLRLTTDDLEKAVTEKEVEFQLPAGVVVTSVVPKVPLTVARKQ